MDNDFCWWFVVRGQTHNNKGNVVDGAKQFILTQMTPLFLEYDRIDLVFDSDRSENIKSFIKRHGQGDRHVNQ